MNEMSVVAINQTIIFLLLNMFQYLEDEMFKSLQKNKSKVSESLIHKIHPDIDIYYNSINIFVGKQGSGKTFNCLKEIIKISSLGASHLLVYVTKSGNKSDVTFESLTELINIPIVYVSQDDAEDYVKCLLSYKQLYYNIKEQRLEDKIVDEQRNELFNILKINDFKSTMLHTLILLEDIANNKLLANDHSYFNNLMTTCRHNHLSFFLNVQFWKSLSTTIKSNVSTVFVFGTYSRQQLQYITHQLPLTITFDELYDKYKKIFKHDSISIDCNTGKIKFNV